MEQQTSRAQPPSFVDEGLAFDPRAYWGVLVRRRWLVIPFFLVTVLVVTLVTLRQPKIYAAVCTLVVDASAPRFLDQTQVQEVVDSAPASFAYSREHLETQVRIITSRAVAQRTADRLGLAADDHFLGLDEVPEASRTPELRQAADPAGLVIAAIRVEPVPNTRLLRIVAEDRNPERAVQIANGLAEAYVAETLAVKSSTTRNASDWLEEQLAELERKLDESGRKLFDFKRSHEIVATSWEDRQSMVSQRVTAINEALTRARVERAQLQARAEAVEALDREAVTDEDLRAIPAVAGNASIQGLKNSYFALRADCADLETKYLTDHPRVSACKAKVAEARALLREEIRVVLLAARREHEQVSRVERNLQALLEQTKSDAFALNQYEREYMELRRQHENNQRLYDVLLRRLKDTDVTGMLQVSNVRILDPALPNHFPVRPNVRQSLFLAIALGLLGGVVLAFAAEFFDASVATQQQVEDRLGIAFLGVVPRIARGKDGRSQDLIVSQQPKSAAAECLRSVRTNLLFMSPDRPLRTLLVTSSAPQDGKTTVAAGIAQIMADGGKRVLLVDADMRRPRIHRIFGVPSEVGLSSLILGEGTLETAVKQTMVPNLSVLPCGPIPPNPAELLHTAAFVGLLEELAKRYDRIILDSPPVGVVADAVILSTQVDGTVLVLKAGQTSRFLAKQALHTITDVQGRVFGAVLNDLDLEDQRYAQYAYYRYGYYYGDERAPGPGPAAD